MAVAGVVLAAGFGTRLRPLTELRPKPLCPVANTALVDHAITRLSPVVDRVAVNVHHHRVALEHHLTGRDVHLSVEASEPLGTAGALGQLREWLDGDDVVVTNSDTWFPGAVPNLLEGWDGERARLLVVSDDDRADFDGQRFAGVSAMPWSMVASIPAAPAGLWEVLWSAERAAGRLDLVPLDGGFVACDTPRDYLEANLSASGGQTVIGEGAVVDGEAVRCVVWPGAVVEAGERLSEVIRAGDRQSPVTVAAHQ